MLFKMLYSSIISWICDCTTGYVTYLTYLYIHKLCSLGVYLMLYSIIFVVVLFCGYIESNRCTRSQPNFYTIPCRPVVTPPSCIFKREFIERISYGTEKRFQKLFRLVWMYCRHSWMTVWIATSSKMYQQVENLERLLWFYSQWRITGDSFHLEAASGLSRPTAYVHQVEELICTKTGPHCMGPALLKEKGYMESDREHFQLRNGMPYFGAAADGTRVPYFPNSGESQHNCKNWNIWYSMLCYASELSTASIVFLIWTSSEW